MSLVRVSNPNPNPNPGLQWFQVDSSSSSSSSSNSSTSSSSVVRKGKYGRSQCMYEQVPQHQSKALDSNSDTVTVQGL